MKLRQLMGSLLDVQPDDRVLEIGFGPGLAIRELSRVAHEGYICGLDRPQPFVARRHPGRLSWLTYA
jgi:protein-L-isoaspartate O-methyltransferase